MIWQAQFFDGRSTRAQPVHLQVVAGELRVQAVAATPAPEQPDPLAATADAPEALHFPALALQVSEPWQHAPLAVVLPGGGSLWVAEGGAALRQQLGLPLPRAARCMRSWPGALACLLATLALLFWFDRQGAGLMADAVVQVLPRSVDDAIGDHVEGMVGKQWLAPSHVDAERQQALAQRLHAVAQRMAPQAPVNLRFARLANEKGSEGGFNAFALPNGAIVMLDGMAEVLTDDEVLAVLGHELGHVVHRHGLRSVVRGFGLLAVASAALGDFSTVVAGAAAGVQSLHYSRDAERQADAFARRFVAEAGLPKQVLASVWQKMKREERRRSITGMPLWLSTHPSTDERLEQLADQPPGLAPQPRP